MIGEFLNRAEAHVGDLLFGQVEFLSDVLVRPAFDEQKFENLDAFEIALAEPLAEQSAEAASDGAFLQLLPFVAAGDAAGGGTGIGSLEERVVAGGVFGGLLHGVPAELAQMVGQLVRRDGEEVGLQFAFVVVVRQTIQKADEGFLDEVVAGIGIFDATVEEGAEAAFEAGDELPPGVGVSLADRLDQKTVAFISHAPNVLTGGINGDRRRPGGGGCMSDLRVLFEDNHCLAVDKPAGLLTQGVPAGIPTLEAQVRTYLKTTYGKAGNVYLGIPHRLDRPVSGVVLFAKTSKAAARLAEQFRERQVHKVYCGLVEGTLAEPAGEWRDWLRKVPEESRTVKAEPGEVGAKEAVLRYRSIREVEGGSLVEFVLETGRMHQIRLQASLRGHPLWGDEAYGSMRPFGPAAELARDRIIALHAKSLTFLHPIRYDAVTVESPVTWLAATR